MYYVGVDLGGTNIAVGIVTYEGKIIAKKSVKTMAERPFEEIIKDMADCTLALLKETNISLDEVKSIGIGSPGSLDTETECRCAGRISQWLQNARLCQQLQRWRKCSHERTSSEVYQ